jgi:hypothetical protein
LSPHFLLDSSPFQTQHTPFHPEDGQKNREHFEQKYGRRGEKLIAALGSGLPGVLDYHIQEQQTLVHYLCLFLLLITMFLLVLIIKVAGFVMHLNINRMKRNLHTFSLLCDSLMKRQIKNIV